MSEENIRAARSFFRELNSAMAGGGGVDEVFARYCEPGIVSELGAMEGTVSGPDGAARYLEGQLEFIDRMQVDPEEFIEVESRIVVPFRLHGRARETELPIEFRYAQLFTMRAGRFRRVRMFSTKEKALAMATEDVVTQADIEIVRAMVDAFGVGELNVVLDHLDEYVLVIPLEGHPDLRPVHGREGMLEFMRQWLEPWDDYEFQTIELVDSAGSVIWTARNLARQRSGMEMDVSFSTLCVLSGGKIVQLRFFRKHEEALDAARRRISAPS